jgi:Caspase domain
LVKPIGDVPNLPSQRQQKTFKTALLIGVSECGEGFNQLPGAAEDVEAIQRVLLCAEMGNFDEAKILNNPGLQEMMQAVETLFTGRNKDDLVLLFFSGHGIKDSSNKLYLATGATCKNSQGELVKSTAVPASFIHEIMDLSPSKQQVLILDCCFSGAFADGLLVKDDGSVNVNTELGGEGRVILTSSTSTQYSFARQEAEASIYTSYLVEGIETGAADLNRDGVISVDELHQYTKSKIRETIPAMKPEIYAGQEGCKIQLARTPEIPPSSIYLQELRPRQQPIGINNEGALTPDVPTSLTQTQKSLQAKDFPPKTTHNKLWLKLRFIVLFLGISFAASYLLIYAHCVNVLEKYKIGGNENSWIVLKFNNRNEPERKMCKAVQVYFGPEK